MKSTKDAPDSNQENLELAPEERKKINIIFLALMVAMLMSALDQTVFGTALPTIVGELNGVEHMLWVSTAYILASTLMMPLYGKFGDLIGRKILFLSAIVLFIFGSIIGALAHTMEMLIIGRAIQGLGGGGLMILAQSTIADVVPIRQRGKYMGMIGAVYGLASVLGPLLGGWFTDGIGWRWAFWINIPFGLLSFIVAAYYLDASIKNGKISDFDWLGILTISVSTTCLILTTSFGGNTYAWTSWEIRTLIIGSIIFALLFILVESKAREPIIPLKLFKDRNFNLATITGLFIGIAMFGALGYLPTYYQMVDHFNAMQAGYAFLPFVFGIILTSTIAGKISSKTGKYKWMPILGVMMIAASLFLMSTLKMDTSIALSLSYLFLMGMGMGFSMQMLVLIVQNSFPQEMVGTATGSNNFFREIGAAIGGALVGNLFTHRLTNLFAERIPPTAAERSQNFSVNSIVPSEVNKLPEALKNIIMHSYNDALTPVFAYLVPMMLVGIVILLFIKERPLRDV